MSGVPTERERQTRQPRFGERFRNPYASENNPTRDGIYVETIRRTAKMNSGTWYRFTDGKGNFWETPAGTATPLPAEEPDLWCGWCEEYTDHYGRMHNRLALQETPEPEWTR